MECCRDVNHYFCTACYKFSYLKWLAVDLVLLSGWLVLSVHVTWWVRDDERWLTGAPHLVTADHHLLSTRLAALNPSGIGSPVNIYSISSLISRRQRSLSTLSTKLTPPRLRECVWESVCERGREIDRPYLLTSSMMFWCACSGVVDQLLYQLHEPKPAYNII